MKLNQDYRHKFNHPHSVAVVSLYPKQGEVYSSGASGVASYTKNVVSKLNRPVVVAADVWGASGANRQYQEQNSLVLRVWQRGQFSMWTQIISTLSKFNKIESLLIHFDFSMYGGILTSALILPFLALVRVLGFRPIVVSHHVIKDVRNLSGQVGLGNGFKDTIKAFIYNFIFRCFYWLLGKTAAKVVVLEEPLKQKLKGTIPENKLIVIPHAVDNQLTQPSKHQARKRLGFQTDESVVMFFGYINWFKGADFFANAVRDVSQLNGRPVRFVMAGGESPTLKDKHYYQQFYQQVINAVDASPSLELTGYIPQDRIADYFAAADLVVFPYREFMCASGVMSLVFSYGKPFIVSSQLNPMLSSPDLSRALNTAGLRAMDMTFLLTKPSLLEVTEKVLHNGIKAKMEKITELVRAERSFAATADNYQYLLQPAELTQAAARSQGGLAYELEK